MPSTVIGKDCFNDGTIGLLEVMLKAGLIPSKGEGRRLITQGGVSVNDIKISDPLHTLTMNDFSKGYAVIKKGKKVFHKIEIGQ